MREQKIKFFKNGILFLIILATVISALGISYIKLVNSKKQIARLEDNYLNFIKSAKSRNLEFGFFGDSHTKAAINPMHINNTYNFAFVGEDYVETYYKLKKFTEKDNITIKYAVFQIDPQTFSDKVRVTERLFTSLNVYSHYLSISEISGFTNKSTLALYIQLYFPFIENGDDIFEVIVSPPELPRIHLGWTNETLNFSASDKKQVAERRVKAHFRQDYMGEVQPRSMEYFLKALKLAKEKGSTVILIKYPMTKEYLDAYSDISPSMEKYYSEIFRNVNSSIGSDYILLDYQRFFNSTDLFKDSDHLNYIGSEIFTKRVYKDIKKALSQLKTKN